MTATDTGPQPDPTPVAGEPQTEAGRRPSDAAALAAIARLRKSRPEDDWGDKFYAALGALWQTVKGREMPAMGEPPHVVMAQLIEDVAWRAAPRTDPRTYATHPLAAPRAEGLDASPAALDVLTGPHPDAGNLKANHYDRFTTREADALLSDEGLAETHRKFTEALTDPFVHDAAKIVVELVEEIKRLRMASPAALDVERLTDALSFLGDTDVLADGSVWTVDEIAAKAAAEYARLAQQDGTGE